MCRISSVILIFVCLTSLCAQGQISGIVLDKNTNSPIEYATIILKQGGDTRELQCTLRIDTINELQYYKSDGILNFVLKNILKN